jgi:DNA polymerase-4
LPESALVAALGDAHGRHLHALAHSRDDRGIEPHRAVKSIGHEETFSTDLVDRVALAREVVRMSERVAQRLRAAGKAARTVQLKVRYSDFRTITRSHSWGTPRDLAVDLAASARRLLDCVDVGDGIRLLGVSAQQLVDAGAIQDMLPFDDADATDTVTREERRALELVVDGVRARFGDDALGPAVLLERDGLRVGRAGTPWGPGAEGRTP